MRTLLLAGALLLSGCPDTARFAGQDLGPSPPDISVLFDFSSNSDFSESPDSSVPSDLSGSADFNFTDFFARDSSAADDFFDGATHASDAGSDASPGALEGGAFADMAPPKADLEINYCIVQFPKSAVAKANAPSDPIYGQVFQRGLTDVTMDRPAPGIIGQVGVGPFGSDPRVSSAWTWVATIPTPNYDWKKNNDEYQAPLGGMAIGVYSYAFRFSVTGGAGFTYCDTVGNGSNNGLPPFDPNKAGQLTVN